MNLRVTQCPKCSSTFNTTAKIRSAASGLVRCGACLFVFKAEEHFADEFADKQDGDAEDVFFNEDNNTSENSHSISRAELNRTSANSNSDSISEKPSSSLQSLHNSLSTPVFDNAETQENWQSPSDENVGEITEAILGNSVTSERYQENGNNSESLEHKEFEELLDFTVESEVNLGMNSETPTIDIEEASDLEQLSDHQLHGLNTVGESLQIKSAQRPQLLRNLGIASAFLVLAILVITALLWVRMPSLSQSPKFRPYYEFGCRLLPCNLPVYSDITAISSDSLLASSHPDIPDALLFTIVFRNEAPFQQPFPTLSVRFTNIDQELIAERDFNAAEYLPEGLESLEFMPVGNPIQVSLELVDPGEEAVNYSISFSEP